VFCLGGYSLHHTSHSTRTAIFRYLLKIFTESCAKYPVSHFRIPVTIPVHLTARYPKRQDSTDSRVPIPTLRKPLISLGFLSRSHNTSYVTSCKSLIIGELQRKWHLWHLTGKSEILRYLLIIGQLHQIGHTPHLFVVIRACPPQCPLHGEASYSLRNLICFLDRVLPDSSRILLRASSGREE